MVCLESNIPDFVLFWDNVLGFVCYERKLSFSKQGFNQDST